VAKYVTKPEYVEAITFDELVEHGKQNGANIVDGMPWSFEYKGKPITHENDECYLVPVWYGETAQFTPRHMLMDDDEGNLFVIDLDMFNETYERVEDGQSV
jgi:hypothetical protein